MVIMSPSINYIYTKLALLYLDIQIQTTIIKYKKKKPSYSVSFLFKKINFNNYKIKLI